MKTYGKYLVVWGFLVMACTSTEEAPQGDNEQPNVDADYAILLNNNGTLSSALLKADAETISIDPGSSPFGNSETPELSYRQDMELSFYDAKPDCSGEVIKYDFTGLSSTTTPVFSDLVNCGLEVLGLAHSEENFFVAYSLPGSGLKNRDYFLRISDFASSDPEFADIALENIPQQLVFSNNRVFILSADEAEEDFSLLVLDVANQDLIHDLNLDEKVQRIFLTHDGNVMVSYPEQHLVVNSGSMAITNTVRYEDGKEPKFGVNDFGFFDTSGNLYYSRPTDLEGTEYANIPGVYEFDSNTAILYFYENFLTEEERRFEFEIGDTSLVAYDIHNNLILIGYRKSEDSNLGGLLRIRPIPEPAFIDNIDLPGVPFSIFIE